MPGTTMQTLSPLYEAAFRDIDHPSDAKAAITEARAAKNELEALRDEAKRETTIWRKRGRQRAKCESPETNAPAADFAPAIFRQAARGEPRSAKTGP